MAKPALALRLVARKDLGLACLLTLALAGCGADPLKIQHVVILVQENRTPDNLFHSLPHADIADSGVNSRGERIPLTPIPLKNGYDLNHTHKAFVKMYDGGKMDGADRISCTSHCPPNAQFKYVYHSDVIPYFELAEQYTFGDRMFQTNQGPSFPAHQFIISGTSAPTADSDMFAAENVNGAIVPGLRSFAQSGCRGQNQIVALISPTGEESQYVPPCFEHQTLMDLLDPQSITWRYYTIGSSWENVLWTAPNAIRHLRYGADWQNVIPLPTQILIDITNRQLPAVSWVVPKGQYSDHAGTSLGSGPSWVAAVVNSIGNSPYWLNTAIFIIWDDWGGWYDHVAPPIYNSYEYGFRVPLIVVSPYAKAHFVSHKMHDFGSILKFIEENFSLPTLGYADSRADDLSDCFDYAQVPLTFTTITAPLPTAHFLEDTTPPSDPDDD